MDTLEQLTRAKQKKDYEYDEVNWREKNAKDKLGRNPAPRK